MGQMDIIWAKFGPIGPKRPILKNRNPRLLLISTFLKVITTVSAYIKLLEPTPVTKLAKIGPKEPNAIEAPIVILETCPFGSRHRFDWYDCPQGISKVTLIPYRHPDG
jgi:hypothetical protein